MSATVWHDVECGAYSADLPLWERLAAASSGPVLELGCGSGRVALHLARRGHTVIGVDADPGLVAALNDRAGGLPVEAVAADARDFELDSAVGLALAPMQLVQLLGGEGERSELLRCTAAQLSPEGRIALAIVESMPAAESELPPLPDVREVDGWIFSSLPVDVAVEGPEIAIRRLRQTVSPAGELSEEPNEIRIQALSARQLEREAAAVGLVALNREAVPATDLHVGSTVVVLGRAA
jgi:SAM-dependent methyltransferase